MLLRQLLRSWLQNAAAHKARQVVLDAARQQVRPAAEASAAAPAAGQRPPCHVGVVFALGAEAGGLQDRLSAPVTTQGHGFVVRQGQLKSRHVALVVSGPGRDKAAKATEALLAGHQPGWVISAGFAGGLAPRLKRFDILIVDHLVDPAGNRLAIDAGIDPDQLARTPGVHLGRLLTADRVICRPEEKQSLGRQFDALAVDMETFAVAEVCRRRGVPLLAVRVIHDTADETLPKDVQRLLQQRSTAGRLGAALGAIWQRPSSVKDLYQLQETALLASERLAKFLAVMIEELPEEG